MLEILGLWKHPISTLLSRLILLRLLLLLASHLTRALPLRQLALRIKSNKLLGLLNRIISLYINLTGVVLKNVVQLIVFLRIRWGLYHSDE